MAYIPQVEFVDFVDLVKIHWSIDYDLVKYKSEVARVARKARRHLFPYVSQKAMLAKECTLWRDWIAEIPQGEKVHPEWNRLVNFKESMIGSMAKGDGHEIFPFAIHYRFHRYHKQDDLQFADDIDRHALKKPLRKLGQQVFRYEPDVYDMLQPNAPMAIPPYITPEEAKSAAHWLNPHNHHNIKFSPRPEITRRLENIMRPGKNFRLCPVIGPSGAGKTRLISEWMKSYVLTTDQRKWESGLVVSETAGARDPKPWQEWTIERNTLIVIDYTYAFDAVMHAIIERATQQSNYEIRLVVVDHQMPDVLNESSLWGKIGGGRPAQLSRFEESYLEPAIKISAEKDNSNFLRSIMINSAKIFGKNFQPADGVISTALKNLDRMGREQGDLDAIRHPLFAALMGQIIGTTKAGEINFTNWKRRDLITFYIDGPDRLPWSGWENHKEKESKITEGLLIGMLVSAATLRRGLPVQDAEKFLPKNHKALIEKANRISAHNSKHKIKEFLPDIMGEAFILKFLENCNDNERVLETFISILENCTPDKSLEIAQNFRESIVRLIRNLENDNSIRDDVLEAWTSLCRFLIPSRFKSNTDLRLFVSYSIVEVIQKISGILTNLQRAGTDQHELVSHHSGEPDDDIELIIRRYETLREELEKQFSLSDIKTASKTNISLDAVQAAFAFFEYTDFLGKADLENALLEIASLFVAIEKTSLKNGATAAFFASQEGHLGVLKYLRGEGADINAAMEDGGTPVIVASQNGHLEIVKFLHKQGADINAAMEDGGTAMMLASLNGHLEIVKYLQNQGVDINATTKKHATAMVAASLNGHLEVIKYLRNQGADINAATEDSMTALMIASRQGHLDVVKYLHNEGADVHATMEDGGTTVVAASLNGHLAIVKYLYNQGVDINTALDNGGTALLVASQNGHLEVVKYLREKGADISTTTDNGITSLMIASQNGHLGVVEFLHNEGANISATMADNRTSAMLASLNGHLEVVTYLCKEGVDINLAMNNGMTALMLASQNGHMEVVKYLRKEGADIGAIANNKETGMMVASQSGHLAVVKYLYSEGANINATMKNGMTALMLASLNGHLKVVTYLHEEGADINAVANHGETAVMAASLNGHLEVVKYLYNEGANIYTAMGDGKTAVMLANENAHLEVVQYLQRNELK